MESLGLDLPAPPRRKAGGAALSALERTLRAWQSRTHLTGDESAASRRILRDAALAVDTARSAVLLPKCCQSCGHPVPGAWAGSPYTLAMVTRTFADLLGQIAPPAVPDPTTDDTDDDLPADLAAWLADPPPGNTGPA